MKYLQGDIVEVNYLFPEGVSKPHLAVIVSNDKLQEVEGYIYLVLISSKKYHPEYCYALNEEMTTVNFTKQSYIICHIITGYTERDILRRIGAMKQPYFDEMIDKVIKSVF